MSSTRCEGPNCGVRTRGCGQYCRSCKSKRFHAYRKVERGEVLLEQLGSAWWIWDLKGEVLVIGKDLKHAAIEALAFGDPDMASQEEAEMIQD